MVREGLTMRISMQRGWKVCGDADSEEEAMRKVAELQPQLVIVDISLKNSNGLDLIKQIKSKYPSTKMLVLSGFQESLYAERALRAGAMGYLNKQESNEKVVDAIRTVLAGERFISPELSRRLINQSLGGSTPAKSPIECLTDRELEVFRMIGKGMMSSAIAEVLFISTHTVDSHRENIKRKLALKNAGELTHAAVQWVMENG